MKDKVQIENGADVQPSAEKRIQFAAIDKYIERNIILPTERNVREGNYDMVEWGPNNMYPFYLMDLYRDAATLQSVIRGCVDYLVGDGSQFSAAAQQKGFVNAVNRTGETLNSFLRNLGEDAFRYGGCAYEVIRSNIGDPAEFYWIDLRYLRTNPECDVFFYSEDFGKKYGRKAKTIVYPKFLSNVENPSEAPTSSIVFLKMSHGSVYPEPLYSAAVKACEMERGIDDFHLNSLDNGFSSSYFINFNNGKPSDDICEEVERDLTQKFTGAKNAGRVGFSWNPDLAHRTTFEHMNIDDFGTKFQELAKTSRQKIFTAFRANPNLFGIPTENLGFSSEEYESAFRLFNRTVIRPVQNLIIESISNTIGVPNSISIIPFTM